MRLGYSFTDLAMGGAQAFGVTLAEAMARRGHAVHFTRLKPRFRDVLRGRAAPPEPQLLARLRQVAREVPPETMRTMEVIHLDGFHRPWHKRWYAGVTGRVVETLHSPYSYTVSGPAYSRWLVAVSQFVGKGMCEPHRIIYHGVDTEIFSPAPATPKRYLLGIIGRLHPAKNHELFCRTAVALAAHAPFRVVMIGDYPPHRRRQRQRQLAGLFAALKQARISPTITGVLPPREVAATLNQTMLTLVASHTEGLGLMALESMACGVPVVAGAVGGLPEIIQHGYNGWLVPPGSSATFVKAAANLLQNQLLYRQLSAVAIQTIRSRFLLTRMVGEYEALYREVAGI